MREVIDLLGVASLGWLLAEGAAPAQTLKRRLGLDGDGFFSELLNCSLCLTFWLGLAITLDPLSAAICSVLAEAISRIEKSTRVL